MNMKLTPPLKWYGGKTPLASWIVSLMPPHVHYVEPYAGGLGVLLARDPADRRLWLPPHRGVSEVVNDLDDRLVNFWRVLQDPDAFPQFCRRAQATPFSRAEWDRASEHEYGRNPVADAVALLVLCRQSRAGAMRAFSPLVRSRVRRGMSDNASAWLSAVDGLPASHARLRRVVVECSPALEVIAREDGPGTLFYCDPPYLHDTRTDLDAYSHEMTELDHRQLLVTLKGVSGRVMLSGYPSKLYDRELSSWSRHSREVPNRVAGGDKKSVETEVLWCNF